MRGGIRRKNFSLRLINVWIKTASIIILTNYFVNRKGFINSSEPVHFFANCKVLYPHQAFLLFQPSSALLLRWLVGWGG